MIKYIVILFLLLAYYVVPIQAYCDGYTWNIAASKSNMDIVNKFNSSLPRCIQENLPPVLNIIIDDNDNKFIPKDKCGYSYDLKDKFIIIALHKKSEPNNCYLIPMYAHELGHHYNWDTGISEDPDFIAAIKEDFANLKPSSPKRNRDRAYFKDPGEMAAELFALEFSPKEYYYGKQPIHEMLIFPRSKVIFERHLCIMPPEQP